ncbi:MAG: HAD-IA family hydrolase [Rhodospirillaceae bacterium]|nr:HAD-IA family hydrolase [Rhodospirillaceae bacterium]
MDSAICHRCKVNWGKIVALKLVVFDIDGTLVDSASTIIRCMSSAFSESGRDVPSAEAIRGIIGLSLPEAVGHIAGAISPQELGAIVASYKSLYLLDRESRSEPDALFDGARVCLSGLEADGYLLGIATGKSRRGLDALLRGHDGMARFVAIGTADDGPGKPHPFMLEKVMTEAGVMPEDTAMIGDAVYDMQMARAVGTLAVGVAWGNHTAEALYAAGAQTVVPSFAALTTWLRRALPTEGVS